MLLALAPQLWFITMNPLLERVLNGQPNKKLEQVDFKVWAFFVGFNAMLSWFVLERMF